MLITSTFIHEKLFFSQNGMFTIGDLYTFLGSI